MVDEQELALAEQFANSLLAVFTTIKELREQLVGKAD